MQVLTWNSDVSAMGLELHRLCTVIPVTSFFLMERHLGKAPEHVKRHSTLSKISLNDYNAKRVKQESYIAISNKLAKRPVKFTGILKRCKKLDNKLYVIKLFVGKRNFVKLKHMCHQTNTLITKREREKKSRYCC